MHIDERRTRQVLAVVREAAAEGASFLPGDLNQRLREHGQPLGAWEVRGELLRLQERGVLTLDPDTARWQLVAAASTTP